MAEDNIKLMQGNEACAYGALAAGVTFFGGYPITPSTEIAEILSREMPKNGGRFIQMEDEIASMAAIIGASVAGAKSMTATSGPGFSLMQENLGYAYMTEVPCVVVDVQRGGPSTGLPTKVAQADTMQAKWGTHGDFFPIVLAASTIEDTYHMTIKAFNLAEKYRTPVTLLLDEVLGHMREKIRIPDSSEVEIVNRIKPTVPPEWYQHFELTATHVSPMANYGEGYRFHMTGLTHDPSGFPTAKPAEIKEKLDKLKSKIMQNADDICAYSEEFLDDAHIVVIAYGITARAAQQAVRIARQRRFKVGLFQPITIWPFPEKRLRKILENADLAIVAELNQGQLIHEVRKIAKTKTRVVGTFRYDGELMTPMQIVDKIKEAHR
ncbi:MAG: 2-oxoacid:acceptor oxidoreductase subunit alpha [candidate division Zixibacteria bacterium]|nr:2-oxoacid:acceptor oxidoreductase subunit alpha [candidate division Zixibacteria bacterium]